MKFKVQRQLTAALKNSPGKLAAICDTLSQHGINIEAICVVDNVKQSVTRMVTSDQVKTKLARKASGADVLNSFPAWVAGSNWRRMLHQPAWNSKKQS